MSKHSFQMDNFSPKYHHRQYYPETLGMIYYSAGSVTEEPQAKSHCFKNAYLCLKIFIETQESLKRKIADNIFAAYREACSYLATIPNLDMEIQQTCLEESKNFERFTNLEDQLKNHPAYYVGNRDQAERKLQACEAETFLIRPSSIKGRLVVSCKVKPETGSFAIKHYLIDYCKKGFKLEDNPNLEEKANFDELMQDYFLSCKQ